MNREEWLNRMAVRYCWPHLVSAGAVVPDKWRVSVGFPKGSRGGKGHSIGQCWKDVASGDEHREMFISPILGAEDAVAVLIHELIHASDNCANGHKGPFKLIAKAAGLVGKMTATMAGDGLKVNIAGWIEDLGPYPHAPMSLLTGMPKPGSRLIKCECPLCGYTVRTTQKWISVGVPRCPDGDDMEVC